MAGGRFPSKILHFLCKLLKITRPRNSYPREIHKTISHLVLETPELSNKMLVFDFEGAMLRSSLLFPYFMLVAFEAGGFLRSLLLFLSYPLVWLLGEENHLGLKIMVFISFFGIKKETFRIGSVVLPKFFLEDVGCEGFEAVMSFQRKVATSNMPRVTVECFLKDYIGAEDVVARDIKSFYGYFLGFMEEKKEEDKALLQKLNDTKASHDVIGITSKRKCVDRQLFSHCKEAHIVSGAEKRKWHILPREKYPKPLIFHDGRLAFRPTPSSSLAFFMWMPLGLFLCIFRITFGRLLPFKVTAPILAFSGTRTTASKPYHNPHIQNEQNSQRGMLYVCNHRTLLDPLYISYVLDKPLSAVIYSLSRFNELVSPIKTIRLTRDREKDRETMGKLLGSGSLVVCPEGTTCREPYLLRFSPLFAELTDDIVPVAVDVQVSISYGTTASGNKALDPFFHFLNPNPTYNIKVLERLEPRNTCQGGGKSRIEAANHVQNEIGKALGFECTSFTRKDKYMMLAGHQGIAPQPENGRF